MIAGEIGATPNILRCLFTNVYFPIMLIFHSWNHHYCRLNDECNEKVEIAYANIVNTQYNSTSEYVANNTFWFPLAVITLIITVLLIYKCCKRCFKQ